MLVLVETSVANSSFTVQVAAFAKQRVFSAKEEELKQVPHVTKKTLSPSDCSHQLRPEPHQTKSLRADARSISAAIVTIKSANIARRAREKSADLPVCHDHPLTQKVAGRL